MVSAIEFCPRTPDNLPIIGPAECEGLIVATGHYRNDILLAPITARLVREWIMQGRTTFDATAFSPLRFKEFCSEAVQITLERNPAPFGFAVRRSRKRGGLAGAGKLNFVRVEENWAIDHGIKRRTAR